MIHHANPSRHCRRRPGGVAARPAPASARHRWMTTCYTRFPTTRSTTRFSLPSLTTCSDRRPPRRRLPRTMSGCRINGIRFPPAQAAPGHTDCLLIHVRAAENGRNYNDRMSVVDIAGPIVCPFGDVAATARRRYLYARFHTGPQHLGETMPRERKRPPWPVLS